MEDINLLSVFYHEGGWLYVSDFNAIVQQVLEKTNSIPPCTVTKEARQKIEAMLYGLPKLAKNMEQAEGLEAELARMEAKRIKAALTFINQDPYYTVIPAKYIHRVADRKVAAILYCEKTSIWRNRNRLLDLLAIRLLGVSAWEETRNL